MGTLPNMLSKRPHPPEHDLAGVIADANGTSFSNGDEVIGYIPVCRYYPFPPCSPYLIGPVHPVPTLQPSNTPPVKVHSLNTPPSLRPTSSSSPPNSAGKKLQPSHSLHRRRPKPSVWGDTIPHVRSRTRPHQLPTTRSRFSSTEDLLP